MDPQQNQNPIVPSAAPTPEPVVVPPPVQPAPQAPLAPEAQTVPSPPQVPVQPAQPSVAQQPVAAQPSQPQSTPLYAAPPSSKKGLVIGVAVGVIVLLIAGGVGYTFLSKKNTTTASSGGVFKSLAPAPTITSKSACDLFTQSEAQAVIGTISVAPIATPVKTANNVNTSGCIYLSDTDSVTVLIASAANSSGNAGVSAQWSKITAAGLKPVSGVGDKAYYNPTTKALAVLQGNTLVVISENNGKQTQIAKTVIGNF